MEVTSPAPGAPRVVLVSNRLPASFTVVDDAVTVKANVGGLATGLRSVHQQGGAPWIGWNGLKAGDPSEARVNAALHAAQFVPVSISAEEHQDYYGHFSNGALWPILHDLTERMPLEHHGWDAYRAVNERFARTVAQHARPGDLVWVHDYHLMLVPRLLRNLRSDVRVGFFLHVPFPPRDIWALLPWRTELLSGLLGADVIGFHTWRYVRHFMGAATEFGDARADVDVLVHPQGRTRVGAFPMGVDAPQFEAFSRDAALIQEAQTLRGGLPHVVLGIDRLDYTKGIRRRILVVDRLLEMAPELRGKLRFIQVATPSRQDVEAYDTYRREVDELVGRVNGRWATPSWTPIHYMHQTLGTREVATLYQAADVILVTPLRDGMNLVAKEYVATCKPDGVLVLSEFAGAAAEMGEALTVNPYDVNATAEALLRGLHMPPDERTTRMTAMKKRVSQRTVHTWSQSFVQALAGNTERVEPHMAAQPDAAAQAILHSAGDRPLQLFLDFDGTLVPIAEHPDLVHADPQLIEILNDLADLPGAEVHVVSGRPRTFLEAEFRHANVSLHAEHGACFRLGRAGPWTTVVSPGGAWMPKVRAVMQDYADRTTGAFVEQKAACLVWHHRRAPADVGRVLARELQGLLGDMLSNAPVEVHLAHGAVEVRTQGADKASSVRRVARTPACMLVAIGDDLTDEDMFAALPEDGVAIAVGDPRASARWTLEGPPQVRQLLQTLARRARLRVSV